MPDLLRGVPAGKRGGGYALIWRIQPILMEIQRNVARISVDAGAEKTTFRRAVSRASLANESFRTCPLHVGLCILKARP